MKYKLFLSLILFTSLAFSQGEANIWYFGNHAGLDFNSGSPVALTDGQLNTNEGCASLSDAAGQVLFYTDGITVYNKNHQVMLNGTGLMGHSSSTQSATIVPKPGSANLFYLFTIDALAGLNGFRYSEIDINLDGGLGGITANKNILIYTPTCEKISIIKHSNNIDFWILTHGWNNNTFYAHLLTSSGLNNNPVISNSGLIVNNSIDIKSMGYMKVSPNGSKLIVCHQFLNQAELFDFDNVTGVISNPNIILNDTGQIYGAEFSANSEVLYISTMVSKKLFQFDLTANNIQASSILLNVFSPLIGGLQLGPDGKIYIAQWNSNKLSVINNPDIVGVGCNLQIDNIDLAGKLSIAGLPAFNQSYFFNPAIELENTCLGETTQFELNTNQTILSAVWDFGDGSPTSNNITASHTYSAPGTYTVSVNATSTNGVGVKTRDIVISAVPTATQPLNILKCDNNNDGLYAFDLTTQNTAILNGQNPALFTVKYFASATDYSSNTAIATPNNYVNATAYIQQTIIAEVSNNANANCKSTTTFEIDVFDTPTPNLAANIPNLTSCDNTSVGSDVDGKVVFDLTQRATSILNGQSPTGFSISYYTDAALTNVIAVPASYQNTNATQTIYVKVANNENLNCFATTSFNIQVFALPVITTPVDLKQCDDDIDGFSVFNLNEAIDKVTSDAANETIAFFETLTEAQNNTNPITNISAYTNQTVSNDVVFVRVTNGNGCFRTAQLNLIVSTTQIPLTYTQSFTVCDDAVLGTNTDGISAFDFSGVTNQIQNIFPAGQLLDITYYRNLADALAESNAIINISNYRNIGYPTTQNIYIRVDSQLNNDCLGLGNHITLHVESIPIVNPIVQTHCDDDQDGLYAFDTTAIQASLLNGLTNVTVTYFDQNNNLLSSPLPNPFVTASQTIKAVVTNNSATACNFQTTIQFIVDDLPEAFPIPATLTTACDDEIDPSTQNGLFAFDTTTFEATILGTQPGMTVMYYDVNNNLLPSPLPNPFVTATQNVTVEVINPLNTNCYATMTIPFVVHPVPNIVLTGEELVCSNNPSFTKTIDAGLLNPSTINDFTYIWYKDGIVIPSATGYSLTVNQEGIYTVAVTNNYGCTRTRTITVTASDIATIDTINVTDLSDDNTVIVMVSGLGDYVYSLDNQQFQDSNTFYNVDSGIYTVYVKDLNGCGIASEEISVLGIPKYFTPNGDGFNDFWNIKGANATLNDKTIIYIFDRYGKLVKQISPTSQGWNGTFNGKQMPASDYWYAIELKDGRTARGHFTLKR